MGVTCHIQPSKNHLELMATACEALGTYILSFYLQNNLMGDFPGGPVIKALSSNAGGAGSFPGQGAKSPHTSGPKKPKHKTEAIL